MKRWDANSMLELGKKLFAQIHRQKKHANHNHDVHIMAREIDEWLPQGIQSLIDGTYAPRCLKRYCFEDEVVDHVHLSDRILQHLLLKQLKPTFKHVMNSNVYHNVRLMVADQVSPAQIKRYFVQWARWWVKTANTWDFQSLVEEFIRTCWQEAPAKLATDVLSHYITELYSDSRQPLAV